MSEKTYLETNNICIYNDDFLTITCIKKNSIDLIVTSPPYNVDIRYGSFDDKIPYNVYLEFTQKWLKKAYTLLKDDSRFCLNIPLDKKLRSSI
jgi:site-specific DNA-methyltransferase (adenine-specific)